MDRKSKIRSAPVGCSIEQHDEVVVLKLPADLLPRTTDLNFRDRLLDFLQQVAEQHEVKVLVMMSFLERAGREQYIQFHRQLFDTKDTARLNRLGIVLDQIIVAIAQLPKISIFAGCGKAMPFSLNISLACDYRIITDDSVYEFPYLDLGLLPKGGSAYFLSKIVGCNKAFEILSAGSDISAGEALERGLVQEVVPGDDLEDAALRAAGKFAQKPLQSIVGIKRLLNYCRKDLEAYLEFETRELRMLYSRSLNAPK